MRTEETTYELFRLAHRAALVVVYAIVLTLAWVALR